jgi:hypothetical protein
MLVKRAGTRISSIILVLDVRLANRVVREEWCED